MTTASRTSIDRRRHCVPHKNRANLFLWLCHVLDARALRDDAAADCVSGCGLATPEPFAVFLGLRARNVLHLCAAARKVLARAPLVEEQDGPAVHELLEERFSPQPHGLVGAIPCLEVAVAVGDDDLASGQRAETLSQASFVLDGASNARLVRAVQGLGRGATAGREKNLLLLAFAQLVLK